MSDSGELVEEAAVAILARSWGLGTMEAARADAQIAFEVFEKARANTNVPTVAEWDAQVLEAREHAIAKGYTPEHDAKHGVRHLLRWAIDYSRRGRAADSSGLVVSALHLLEGAGE